MRIYKDIVYTDENFMICEKLNKKTDNIIFHENTLCINENAFCDSNIKKIEFNDNITEIKGKAFFRCRELSEIKLPENLKSIGEATFSDCKKIHTVEFKNNIESIGPRAFSQCSDIEKIDLSKTKVLMLEELAFFSCSKLKEILLPDDLKIIGKLSLANTSLERITLPENLKIIDFSAFTRTNIEEVELPKNITHVSGMFISSYDSKLRLVTCPEDAGRAVIEKLKNIFKGSGIEFKVIPAFDIDRFLCEGKSFKEINNAYKKRKNKSTV